jgi:hypothetical protein
MCDVEEDRPGIDILRRMRLKCEARHDAEVAAAAAQRPEQLRVFVLTCRHDAAVGQYDLGRKQIVDGEAVFAR